MNYLNHKLSLKESHAINSLRFICIISVVMIHSNVYKYTPNELLPTIQIIHHVFIGIPNLELLFILSGFLFFYNIDVKESLTKAYSRKIKKRIRGLLVPYIIWNTVGLVFDLYIKPSPDVHIESISDLLLGYWPLDPMEHPYGRAIWFIRNLIFFSIVSPIYFYLIKYVKHFTLLIIIIFLYVDIPIDYLYFNPYLVLGSYLGFYKVDIFKLVSRIDWRLYLSLFIPILILHAIFRSVNVLNVVFVLCSFCTLISVCLKWSINKKISSLGMFIYVSHLYINYGITNAIISHSEHSIYTLSFTMILSWTITLFICIIGYRILKRFTPNILNIIIGGR